MVPDEREQQATLLALTRGVRNETLRQACVWAAETPGVLSKEMAVLESAVAQANKIMDQFSIDPTLLNLRETRKILDSKHRLTLPAPCDNDPDGQWRLNWQKTIAREATEVPSVYTDPAKINGGNPEDVFRWYLLDGYSRFVPHLFKFPDDDKKHEAIGDFICSAVCEAMVVLAETGNAEAKKYVAWMNKLGFIKDGQDVSLFSPELAFRARAISSFQ